MTRAKWLVIALLVPAMGCARNHKSEAAGARIRDTTLTAQDTVKPNDTLPRIRPAASDSNPH